jgi:hypothetical protein
MTRSKPSKTRTLKRYIFDAGNSNTGVAGIVVAVKAYSKREATHLANQYIKAVPDPIDLEVEKAWGLGGSSTPCIASAPI